MRLFVAVLLLSAAFAQTDSSAQPIKFRGAYIGEPVSDLVDCSSGKPKVLREEYKAHGKCGTRMALTRMKSKAHFMGPVTDDGEVFLFEEGKLAQIKIFTPIAAD